MSHTSQFELMKVKQDMHKWSHENRHHATVLRIFASSRHIFVFTSDHIVNVLDYWVTVTSPRHIMSWIYITIDIKTVVPTSLHNFHNIDHTCTREFIVSERCTNILTRIERDRESTKIYQPHHNRRNHRKTTTLEDLMKPNYPFFSFSLLPLCGCLLFKMNVH